MKRILTTVMSFVFVLAFAFSSQFSVSNLVQLRANSIESKEIIDAIDKKIYSEMTTDGDFADDRVLVVLNNQETKQFKNYRTSDFSDIGIAKVDELSKESAVKLKEQQARKKEDAKLFSRQLESSGEMEINADNFRTILCLTLQKSGKQEVLNAIKKLEQRKEVVSAGVDFPLYPDSVPDPIPKHYSNQWALHGRFETDNYYSKNSIMAEKAWDIPAVLPEVKIGVIDSGIQGIHPDFKDRLNTTDLNRDFTLPVPFIPSAVTDTSPIGHGTRVAGIIGANGRGVIGVVGQNVNVELVSLKIAKDNTGDYFASYLILAVSFAGAAGIGIVNNSNGTDKFTGTANFANSLKTAISNYPGLFVTSAGNENRDNDSNSNRFPSNFRLPNLISVGAINSNGGKASYSNYGANNVDIFAPGDDIYSTAIGGYGYDSGTSYAAPMVAGVAALIKAVAIKSAAEIKNIIMASVDYSNNDIAAKCVSGGILNAYKALLTATTGYASSKIVTFHDGSSTDTIDDTHIQWDPYQYTGLNLRTLYNYYGMVYITFNVVVEIKEIDDGYQEVYMQLDNNSGEFLFDTEIENSSGWHTYTRSKLISLEWLFKIASDNPRMRLGYGAHGKNDDDWLRRKAQIKIFVS